MCDRPRRRGRCSVQANAVNSITPKTSLFVILFPLFETQPFSKSTAKLAKIREVLPGELEKVVPFTLHQIQTVRALDEVELQTAFSFRRGADLLPARLSLVLLHPQE